MFASKTDCLFIDLTSAAVRERSVVVPEATAMAIVASEMGRRRRRERMRVEERRGRGEERLLRGKGGETRKHFWRKYK